LVNKLLRECEINCNGLITHLDYLRDDQSNGNNVSGVGRSNSCSSSRLRRHSRPFTNQCSFTAAIQSCSLPNEDPCCSQSLYSTSTATSPSLISQPSSPAILNSIDRRSRRRSRRETAAANSRRTSAVTIANNSVNANEEKRNSNSSGGGGLIDRL